MAAIDMPEEALDILPLKNEKRLDSQRLHLVAYSIRRNGYRSLDPTQALEEVLPTGTVKWFNKNRGYGFLEPNDHSRTVFVHISAVEQAGHLGLREGQKVTYDLESRGDGRTSAVNLRID